MISLHILALILQEIDQNVQVKVDLNVDGLVVITLPDVENQLSDYLRNSTEDYGWSDKYP